MKSSAIRRTGASGNWIRPLRFCRGMKAAARFLFAWLEGALLTARAFHDACGEVVVQGSLPCEMGDKRG